MTRPGSVAVLALWFAAVATVYAAVGADTCRRLPIEVADLPGVSWASRITGFDEVTCTATEVGGDRVESFTGWPVLAIGLVTPLLVAGWRLGGDGRVSAAPGRRVASR